MFRKLTRRDWWAFCAGQSVMGIALAFAIHSGPLFLLNALLLGYDAFMFVETLPKDE